MKHTVATSIKYATDFLEENNDITKNWSCEFVAGVRNDRESIKKNFSFVGRKNNKGERTLRVILISSILILPNEFLNDENDGEESLLMLLFITINKEW